MPQTQSDTPKTNSTLDKIKTWGVIIFAATAGLSSINIFALIKSPDLAQNATRITPADLLLAALSVVALIHIIRNKKDFKTIIMRILPPVGAWLFFATLIISSLLLLANTSELSATIKPVIKELVQMFEVLILAYAVLRFSLDNQKTRMSAVWALGALTSVHILMALIQLFSTPHMFYLRGLFAHRNHFGMYLTLVIPLLAGLGVSKAKLNRGGRIWLLCLTALAPLVISSGGLLLALILGVLTSIFIVMSMENTTAPWAAIAGLLFIVLVISPLAQQKLRASQFDSVAPLQKLNNRFVVSERAKRLTAVQNCLKSAPYFGTGLGQYQSQVANHYAPRFNKGGGDSTDPNMYDKLFDEPGSQSAYEITATEGGSFALGGFILWLGSITMAIWRKNNMATITPEQDTNLRFKAGSTGAILGVLIGSFFVSLFVQGIAPIVVLIALLGQTPQPME